jgi:hypothetical protein
MKFIILLSLLSTSCIIPHLPEERCIVAGLTIKSLDVTESTQGKQQSKVHCEESVDLR